MAPPFDTYKDSFPHAKLARSASGELEIVLHTKGDTLVFNGHTHTEFVELFHQSVRMPTLASLSSPAPVEPSSTISTRKASTFSRLVALTRSIAKERKFSRTCSTSRHH